MQTKDSLDINFYRTLVKHYINQLSYKSALFWADKAVSLSGGEVCDVVLYAQCLFLTRQYHRAAHLLHTNSLYQESGICCYLAARCHFEAGELQKALDVLQTPIKSTKNLDTSMETTEVSNIGLSTQNINSAIQLLKGQVYEAQDNREQATICYKEALKLDVFCSEAFDALISHQMLTSQEEKELLKSLPLDQLSKEDATFVMYLYESKLKKYSQPNTICSALPSLQTNLELQAVEAERLYYNCDYRKCHAVTQSILKADPYHSECLPIHIACLVELKKSNDLFYLAHNLVDLNPEKAVAWFGVGCFYFLTGKFDPARKYLNKAVTLERMFGPAWLAYGHAFAIENEHDQAMAAYSTALQLMRGCHLPMLYVGLEYGLTNNVPLAEKFLEQALLIAPNDPFVLHEMGVIAFQKKDYESSEKYFRQAMERVGEESHTVEAEKWEPLLNNLAHVCRKRKNFEDALDFHRKALALRPGNSSTYSGIGYCYALMGECSTAVNYFHKALGFRRDDTFSTTMLGNVIHIVMKQNGRSEENSDTDENPLASENKSPRGGEVEMETSD